jgi:hypothetical protein
VKSVRAAASANACGKLRPVARVRDSVQRKAAQRGSRAAFLIRSTSLMVEHSDFDDWIPHTVAREAVRIAWHCDDVGAESHLIEYMSKLPPDGWRSRPWGTQIVAAVEGARTHPSFVAESARAMQIRLWKEAHTPRDGALIHVRGNEAIYRGPLLWLPVWVEVSSPKGVIIPKYSPLIIPNSLTVIDMRRQAEIHLGGYRLASRPACQGPAARRRRPGRSRGRPATETGVAANFPLSPALGRRGARQTPSSEGRRQETLGGTRDA